jgi:hypothetical protein
MRVKNDRIYTRGSVTITRHHIDWPNLGPEYDEIMDATAARISAVRKIPGCHYYLNPMFTLFAPPDVPERTFLAQANWACMIWMKQLKAVVGQRHVRRFQRRESTFIDRMVLTSGVLVLGGKDVHIKRLNDA